MSTDLTEYGQCLKKAEGAIKWTASDGWNESKRDKWMSEINQAVTDNNIITLYNKLYEFEKTLRWSSQTDEWKTWKRDYWVNIALGGSDKGVDTTANGTHFLAILRVYEAAVNWSSSPESWKNGGRDSWMRMCDDLIHPLARLNFYSDCIEQIERTLGVSIQGYKNKVHSCCRTLRSGSDTLEKVTRDTGIAKATGGGAAIAGGSMALFGILAAPFTAGGSLVLTGAGGALAAAGGVTSFSASMIEQGWDKDKIKESNQATKAVTKYTMMFNEILTEFGKAAEQAKEYMKTTEGQLLVEYMKKKTVQQFMDHSKDLGKIGKGAYNLINAGLKVKDVARMYKIVGMLRPELAAQLGSKIATVAAAPGLTLNIPKLGAITAIKAGGTAAKFLSAASGVLSIGFGIWDVVEASDQLKHGSGVAKMFREHADNVEESSRLLLNTYYKIKN